MIKISTSILSSNNRVDSIKKLNDTNCNYIHLDVMDNKFVQNYQFPIEEINKLIPLSTKKIDIHLMVENPLTYINKINNSNIEYITIHYEINDNIDNILQTIKNKGYKVGLAIKPKTKIDEVKEYLNKIDMLLIMSVEPGYGGQSFIPNTINKINELKQLNKDLTVEVDGGINDKTIKQLYDISDIAVVGSYIINQIDYNKAINNLKN